MIDGALPEMKIILGALALLVDCIVIQLSNHSESATLNDKSIA